MDFRRDATGPVVIVENVVFGIVAGAVNPVGLTVFVVICEFPIHRGCLAGVKSFLRRWPSHRVKSKSVTGSNRIRALN